MTITILPLPCTQGRGRGRGFFERRERSPRDGRPLSPALSPEYWGEGDHRSAVNPVQFTSEIRSSEDLAHDPSVHVRQPVVAAGVAVGQAFVVDAHRVEQGGVEVVDADAV